ncbi:MAG: hypothetical protein J3Q66DRAFT_442842 [Benniella sp.]|nr:MAG: hypothetical protein J3Q66DRAFT_442842 [Benniella sp.]
MTSEILDRGGHIDLQYIDLKGQATIMRTVANIKTSTPSKSGATTITNPNGAVTNNFNYGFHETIPSVLSQAEDDTGQLLHGFGHGHKVIDGLAT